MDGLSALGPSPSLITARYFACVATGLAGGATQALRPRPSTVLLAQLKGRQS